MRVYAPGNTSNLAVADAVQITCLTAPRSKRSARSSVLTSVVVGTITAPSFMQASMVSHNATSLGISSITRSPRATPSERSQLATCDERADMRAKLTLSSVPFSSTIHSAGASLPRAIASK